MAMAPEAGISRVFVVVNAKSGKSSPEEVRKVWKANHGEASTDCHIEEPAEGEDIRAVVRRAVAQGFDTVVAAGGDGTVSAVANGLIGTEARLGIIPLGTANVLARELGIPMTLKDACTLLAGPNTTRSIDAIEVKGTHYFTQVGIGVDALMIRDTTARRKRLLGTGAYVWTAMARIMGFQPHRFSIAADDGRTRPRALQVVLANCGSLGASGLRWGPDVCVDDGKIDVCILRARTSWHFLSVGWSLLRGRHGMDRNIQIMTARRAVAVHTDRPLPVQGDGEVIGETPLEVRVVRSALRVIVPANHMKNCSSIADRSASQLIENDRDACFPLQGRKIVMNIVHLSDIHIWRYTWNLRHLMGRRALGILELLMGRAKRFQLDRLAAVVDRVLGLEPDHILITGDLTTTALPAEFRDATRLLAPLLSDPARATVIPGNHDRATGRSFRSRRFEGAFGAFMPTLSFPWLRQIDRDTAILGLDPTRPRFSPRGRLPEAQLAAAQAMTVSPDTRPGTLIVACHYPVVAPQRYERELFHKRLDNEQAVRTWLAGIGPHLYCCGHVHAAWAFQPSAVPNQICLNAGAP